MRYWSKLQYCCIRAFKTVVRTSAAGTCGKITRLVVLFRVKICKKDEWMQKLFVTITVKTEINNHCSCYFLEVIHKCDLAACSEPPFICNRIILGYELNSCRLVCMCVCVCVCVDNHKETVTVIHFYLEHKKILH